jgi:hypothetical protein
MFSCNITHFRVTVSIKRLQLSGRSHQLAARLASLMYHTDLLVGIAGDVELYSTYVIFDVVNASNGGLIHLYFCVLHLLTNLY